MEKSSLVALFATFSAFEIREAARFLQSPFFNQRQDVQMLFHWLTTQTQPQANAAWAAVFPDRPYDEQAFRLLMSYLHRLLEQYLTVRQMTNDPIACGLHLTAAYRLRNAGEAFERTRRATEKRLATSPLRNGHYLEQQYKLQWETHQRNYPLKPTDVTHLSALSATADAAYLARKLQIICLMTAHQSVYTAGLDTAWQDEVIARAQSPAFARQPAIAIFLYCYYMLRFPEEEQHFTRFKECLFQQADAFPEEEIHGLFLLAVNYCVRRLNAGDTRYYGEVLDMYKQGLIKDYLLENGVLSRFTYLNIAAAAIQSGALDWASQFIEQYKPKVEKSHRESAHSYNLARLAYAQKDYNAVLELLQKANYRDPLLNLGAKTLLLKTCYEIAAFDLLQSQLDALRNYIHRKRVLGYHRTNYLNIIRYTEKLMRLSLTDKAAVAEFAAAVTAEAVLTEKAFFLKIVGKGDLR